MRLTSPAIELDEEATESLISSTVSKLENEVDSFAILSQDDMTYVQALMTEHGFVVQFQYGSINEHYEFDNYLSRPPTRYSRAGSLRGDLSLRWQLTKGVSAQKVPSL